MTTIHMLIAANIFIVFFLAAFGLTQKGNVKRIKEVEAAFAELRQRIVLIEDPDATPIFNLKL